MSMSQAAQHYSQFAQSGTASSELQDYINQANPHNVNVVGKGVIQCNGLTRCLRPIHGGAPVTDYGISALNSTHARCARTSRDEINVSAGEGETTYADRYTGRCQLQDDIVGGFLVECKNNAADWILVKYGKSTSQFEAHGNAKALFSKRQNVKPNELKSGNHHTIRSEKDIYLSCP